MNELAADLFISLDGFASGEDVGPYFGYAGPELDAWIQSALDEFQTIVMGRKTYEALASFTAAATDELSLKLTAKPKVVFSRTLHEPLVWKNTRIATGDLAREIIRLKQEAPGPIRTIGSLSLVRALLESRLLDRLRLVIFPLVLGNAGRELFNEGYPRINLDLLSTTILDSRLTLLEYRPAHA